MHFDVALAVYILALIHITLYFFIGNRYLKQGSFWLTVLAFLLNAGHVAASWHSTGEFPTQNMSSLLVFLCMCIAAAYLVIYIRYRRPFVSMFVLPVIVVAGIIAQVLPSGIVYKAKITSFWLYIHLPFTILGTAFFVLATMSAVMYFLQERQLKHKNFTGFIFRNFPPIDVINKLNTTTLLIGFYFFTLGLAAGVAWMMYSKGTQGVLSPKLVFSIITWLVFGSIAFIKQYKGLTPRDTALTTVAGFISVLVTYVGVAFFLMG